MGKSGNHLFAREGPALALEQRCRQTNAAHVRTDDKATGASLYLYKLGMDLISGKESGGERIDRDGLCARLNAQSNAERPLS
jgi:hypothetical protein